MAAMIRLLPLFALWACGPDSPPDSSLGWAETADDRRALVVTVLDASTGAAVTGAIVSAGARDAVVGDDGRATLSRLEPGDYAVVASASGYAPSGPTAVTVDAAADGALSLSLTPLDLDAVRLYGAVVGPGVWAAGVEGASVLVDGVVVATTAADGSFDVQIAAAEAASLRVDPPAGEALVEWSVSGVALGAGEGVRLGVTLAARPAEDALYVGSSACASCHADAASGHADTPHGAVARASADLEPHLDELAARFTAGETLALDEVAPGATLTLDSSGATWTAEITDADGQSTGQMPVAEIYGGWRSAAALAVEVGDARYVLPAAWALDGQGLSSGQAAADWALSWPDGWFDADGALDLDGEGRPAAAASWDLQCGGCHATGHRLVEDPAGVYLLEARDAGDVMERSVGCESCHGAGSGHVAASSDDEARATILNPALLAPERRVEVCARCHERTSPDAHPFTDAPAWPVRSDGAALGPLDRVSEYAGAARVSWTSAEPSRVFRDAVGDLRLSPHHDAAAGYVGACEDCHTSHEAGEGASLRVAPGALALCTSCHLSAFPDDEAVLAHTAHPYVEEDRFGSASCQGCHLPRVGGLARPDALSGAGETHAHTLWGLEPQAAVDEFEAAGADELPLGSVPTPGCLDCHVQRDAALSEVGDVCVCLLGDPTERETYEDLQWAYERMFGGEE